MVINAAKLIDFGLYTPSFSCLDKQNIIASIGRYEDQIAQYGLLPKTIIQGDMNVIKKAKRKAKLPNSFLIHSNSSASIIAINNDVIKALNILAKAISTIIASRATEDNDENMEEDKKQKWIELKAKLLYKLTGHEILRQTKEKIGISKEEIYGSSIHREGNQDQSN